ncbi:MAG TPA: ABC transporter ATP-binding protein [Rhizomicrobium sp.]|nr:ABC transporter ATP-binding protein [Rhizomicrobium sp.]
MGQSVATETVVNAVEPFDESIALKRVPSTPFAFIWFLIRTHFAGRVAALVACALIATTIEAFSPLAFSHLVNAITAAVKNHLGFATVWPWIAWLAAIWFGGALTYRLYEYIDVNTGPRMRGLAQKYLFVYLLGHSPRYFQDNFAGKLGQKVKQAGQATIGILGIACMDAVRVFGLVTIGAVLMAIQAPSYAIILGGWTVLYLTIVVTLARRCVVLSKALSDEVSTSTGRLIDAVSNADLVRAFAKAAYERKFISYFLADEMNASRRLRKFLITMRLFMQSATTLLMVALIVITARDIIAGAISLGAFAMIYLLANQIARGVQELSFRMLDYFEQLGTLAEALDLVSAPHEIVDADDAAPLAVGTGHIRFENVSFRHPNGYQVFENLNLEIKPGERVGLVGPSGAGKSTLVRLLRRQFEPQSGRITIDGQDIGHVTWNSLNEAIAEVPQMPGVFHRNVRDNIRYARPLAAEEEVHDAARLAFAHDFIAERDEGYDMIVGEQGIKLSGGERQRVAIARALIKDARVLVLDEATSSLDSESEHLIQTALWTLVQGRTVIAIAHRLSTIAGMDRVVYLDNGKILEDGPHRVLLANQGPYSKLWNRQMGGFIDAA